MARHFLLCCNVKRPSLYLSTEISQNSDFHEEVLLFIFCSSLSEEEGTVYGKENKSLWPSNVILSSSVLMVHGLLLSTVGYIFESCNCQNMFPGTFCHDKCFVRGHPSWAYLPTFTLHGFKMSILSGVGTICDSQAVLLINDGNTTGKHLIWENESWS